MVDPVQPPTCSKIKQRVALLRSRLVLIGVLPIPAPAKAAIVELVALLGEIVVRLEQHEARLDVQGEVIDEMMERDK